MRKYSYLYSGGSRGGAHPPLIFFEGYEKWNLRCLSGYELARNEIFLRHGNSSGAVQEQWGLGQLNCSMGKMERYKRDAYHVGKQSRPTPRLAHVIFYFFFFSIYLIY